MRLSMSYKICSTSSNVHLHSCRRLDIFSTATIYMAIQVKDNTSRIVICFHRRARKQEVRFLPETLMFEYVRFLPDHALNLLNQIRQQPVVQPIPFEMWQFA